MSSILIWKMSWLILSPSGTCKNLYLPQCVLNVVSSDASFVRSILKKALMPSTLENLVAPVRTCGISSRVGSFVILLDDGSVQVIWVKRYSQLAICLFGISQRTDPLVWAPSVLWWSPDEPFLLAPFWSLLCIQWELSVFCVELVGLSGLSWCCILTWHDHDAVKAFGE